MTGSSEFTPEDCFEAIREVADELGHPPSKTEYGEAGASPSERTIRKVLGVNFTEAREMAGVGTPHETDGRKVDLEVDYFAEIDDPETAYWLGTLCGQSTIRTGDQPTLVVNHTVENRHFVEGFHRAIGAGSDVRRYDNDDGSDYVRFAVSNGEFVDHLRDLGVDDSARNVEQFPDVPETLRSHFVRGFLEVRARVSEGGLELRSNHRPKLESLGEWCEALGAKRTYVGELQSGRYSFRIGSVLDVARVFEACWVGLDDGDIRFDPVAQSWGRTICESHPHPESLSFCRTETESNGSTESDPSETPPTDPHTEPDVKRSEESNVDAHERTVTVRPSWIYAVALEGESDGQIEAEAVVRLSLEEYTASLVRDTYPESAKLPDVEATDHDLEIALDLPRPLTVAVEGIVEDTDSPFETIEELVDAALADRLDDVGDRSRLTVDGGTAALLRTVGEGDASAGAADVLQGVLAEEIESD